MEWYYAKNGQQLGPVSQESLLGMYQSGEIRGSDLVWNETMPDWLPLSAAPGLPVPPPMTPDALPADSPPPYTPPSGAYSAPAGAAPATTVLSSTTPSGHPMPPNYLWQSIVCLVVCCSPFAIPAIVYAVKVRPSFDAGDHAGALDASKKAKLWCIIALIQGLVFYALFIAFMIFAGIAGAASTMPQ